MRPAALLALLTACAAPHAAEDPSAWWDAGSDLEVVEPLAFTDVPYDFTGQTPIGDLPVLQPFEVAWEPGAAELPACPDWSTSGDLPAEITGIVTIFPRYYFKTDGCDGDEEKYYGSFFVQDATGGFFVLGDSKVAHFSAGDRVTLKVRGMTNRFDQPMIIGHDVLSVEVGPEPIYYEHPSAPFDLPDIGLVRRVTGVVSSEMDTFGAFTVLDDNGETYSIALDSELNKRGVEYAPGTRLTVTGPVLYSYSVFSIVVMQVGQIEVESGD